MSPFWEGFRKEIQKASAALPIAGVSKVAPLVAPLRSQAARATKAVQKIPTRTQGHLNPAN